ncbi:SCY1-like protein bma [Arctopsyche grandis]|uniref:SCY1-like protein bma n=1 Tax=Arctopsyche grandis TaxID=121162 RepID=UPI00406D90E9
MFSKFKSTPPVVHHPWDANPITEFYDIGKQVASCGPENVWKIHDAYRKNDSKQECSVFIFEKKIAEKLHKPKRKETVTELLRNSIRTLERLRNCKVLLVLHTVEECADTLAFATEPIMTSLANILAFQAGGAPIVGPPVTGASVPPGSPSIKPQYAKEHHFIDLELRYGLLQITEALAYLHYKMNLVHRNVCPSSILLTKRGTWKLGGLEFAETVLDIGSPEPMPCIPWTSRFSKMVQPNLDYIAPEVQQSSVYSVLSDMYSLGMTICAVFNNGRPLIQANYSSSNYAKQMEFLDDQVHLILPRIVTGLQDAVTRLLARDCNQRPTSQILSLIKYFNDLPIQTLQALDVLLMKEPNQKSTFYRTTMMEVLPYIPRKIWWQHIWPYLQMEINMGEVLAAVLVPVMYMVKNSSMEEYEFHMVPTLKDLFASAKSIQASVTILEHLECLLEKTPRDEIKTEVLPLLYNAFDSSTVQIQSAALDAVHDISDYLDEHAIRRMIIPKTRNVYDQNQGDLHIIEGVLKCIECTLDRLEKSQIMDEVLPLLWDVRLNDPKIAVRVVGIYKLMMTDKKYGLTISLMATRVIPLLMPQTINPSINLEQFTIIIEMLREMFDLVEKHQRNKLKADIINLANANLERRAMRHQISTDNVQAPPFNIPNLRVEQRKTSSAEDMARKNSTGSGLLGSWWFGNSSSSQDGNNFLRVASAFSNRRLSDNTLITPKIRIAHSSTSSPGGSPGSGAGLPTRRHSSIGPQERRGSHVNLSPPTGGSMPNSSSSVPFLLSSSMQSIRSRRPSATLGGSHGSGLLHQLGSGMSQLFSGRS